MGLVRVHDSCWSLVSLPSVCNLAVKKVAAAAAEEEADGTQLQSPLLRTKVDACFCIDVASIANMLLPPETPTTIPM